MKTKKKAIETLMEFFPGERYAKIMGYLFHLGPDYIAGLARLSELSFSNKIPAVRTKSVKIWLAITWKIFSPV